VKGRFLLFLLFFAILSVPARAQGDSTEQRRERIFRPQQVIVPAAFITVGAVAISNPRLCEMKYNVRNTIQDWRGTHRKANVETWATLSMPILAMSFNRRTKTHSLVDRLMVKVTGYALLYTVMPITKRVIHEPRPDGHSDHSFVAFKAANAFMGAEQIRVEHGWGWGMGAYTMAAGISFLNMYNDRSYINDVIAGAGMGILATHAAYWLLPLERRWLGLDKSRRSRAKDSSMLILPTYEPQTHTAGLAFTAVW